ncbi:MAG: HEAT repeat domain-containing protein [Synechococcales bacterium]|nr:HEAT repeat domain-containing protein [Synechococcales bacterium]
MLLIVGLVIGFIIGAAILYGVQQGTISRQKQELDEKQRTIQELERNRESRLRETVKSLQADYQKQLDAQMQAASQQHESQVRALETAHADELRQQEQTYTAQIQATQAAHQEELEAIATDLEVQPEPLPSPSSLPEPEPPEASPPPTTPAVLNAATVQARAPISHDLAPLLAKLTTLGHLARPSSIPELARHAQHPSADVRAGVAAALRQINATHAHAPSVQATISPLTTLSRDADPSVRRLAIQALGEVPSQKVVPIIRQALRDPNPQVVKAANAQMERLKFYRTAPPPRKKSFKPPQPNT